jgi:hypothetical protein
MPDLIPAKNGIFDRHPEFIEFTGFALFRFRRNDIQMCFLTFCETIIYDKLVKVSDAAGGLT